MRLDIINNIELNVIPTTDRLGPCKEILFVAIGTNDSIEKSILEAIKHIYAKCPNETKYIIFYAVKWNHALWLKHCSYFKKVHVILKIPMGKPTDLI